MNLGGQAQEAIDLAPEHLDIVVETEIGQWAQGMQVEVLGWHVIQEADVPKDRYFREAWSHTGTKFEVQMDKAREIHRDHLRRLRAPKLTALDVEYMRADEEGQTGTKTAIAAVKRRLRDVTADPRIDAAKTPEELKAVIPEVLNEK